MVRLTRKVDCYSAGQDISRLFGTRRFTKSHPLVWNPKVHYHVHKSPPVDSILIQLNPIHPLARYYSHNSSHLHLGRGLFL
jgi:hypothetical protein